MRINPLTAIDFYKADHRRQYPAGTQQVYSNFTARSAKHASLLDGDAQVVFFGLQYFIKDFLIEAWNTHFFHKPKERVVNKYRDRMFRALGDNAITLEHIEALHDLGYLPIRIKALPEGSLVPIGVPMLTIVNTVPEFFWITNYLETILSAYIWKPITSATIAYQYKKLLRFYIEKTHSAAREFINFQAHDFSFRGMSSLQSAVISGAAHLTSFMGTDSVCSIDLVEDYYGGVKDGILGCSVPATEHSVMCMGLQDGEVETFRRLICELYPAGILSVVSDTWDFWHVVTVLLPQLKGEIMKRDGKLVIRPDSGDPTKIITGDDEAPEGSPERKGAIECLFEIFGGTMTAEGYKVLDSHIGLIYGDSINLTRARAILNRLEAKGFASSNVVLGVGSYTYQYNTRDTFGFAVKATSGIVDGVRRDIFKNPKTDTGEKKSAKGLLRVEKIGSRYVLFDNQTEEQENAGELKTVFLDGALEKETGFDEIRSLLNSAPMLDVVTGIWG
jgi:nicotinamide phosphoribosyltransferase